jgi:crotonobetainyl-CoA:carnitine CoA-transferase CaiB-like acyl-CoA transferase
MDHAPELPLSGIKVLDLSRLLPGPYATLVLADLGAAVDKVENPDGGDAVRHMPPFIGNNSALFCGLNRNKRSLTLDLKHPEGAAALRRLVASYDVLIESFRPGVMDGLGLSYEALQARHPKLIYCSISGYGQTGPDRLKPGHDLNYIARAGVLGYSGERGGAPAMPGVQIADVGGGSLFALVGILAALHERARTRRGRFVDVSMTEGALAFLHMHLAAAAVSRSEQPLARGSEPLNGGYASYNVYRTGDGRYLSIGALEPKFFAQVCERLGRPDLLEQAYDAGDGDRAVRAELARIFSEKPLAQWLKVFEGADACVEPVLEGLEVLDDPQLSARGVFVDRCDEKGQTVERYLRTPLRFGDAAFQPAPSLGQHSRAILAEAGFSPLEIEELREKLGADWAS